MQRRDRYWWLALGLIACAVVLVVIGYRYAGVTWDENLQRAYGEAVLRFFTSGLRDRGFEHIANLYYYGPFFDVLVALANQFVKLGTYDVRHLMQGLVGVVALIGTWRLALLASAARPGSHRTRTALLATAVLATWPMFVGHAFFNPKDIPFAAAFVWSLYAIIKIRKELPDVKVRTVVIAAITIGITLAIKVGGFILFGLLGIVILEFVWRSMRRVNDGGFFTRVQAPKLLWAFANVFVLAYALMLFLWPWAAEDPLKNPLRALTEISHIGSMTFFAGQLLQGDHLPWYYVPTVLAIQAPEIVVIALLGGAFVLFAQVVRHLRQKRIGYVQQQGIVFLLILFALAPWLLALASRPSLYDQARHFLFLIPPLAVLAGIALDAAWSWIAERKKWLQWLFGVSAGAYTVALLAILVYLHPYEYVYGNIFVGGVAGINRNFQMDYWGSSVNESVRLLNGYLAEHAKGSPAKTVVYACGDLLGDSYLSPSYIEFTLDVSKAQYAIGFKRDICPIVPDKALIAIRRFGVPIGWVQKLK